MAAGDSTGPDLQLDGDRFSNFLLGKLSRQFKFPECWYFTKFKWPYFGSAWCYSQMVGHAGSSTGIVHVDMTMTRSKVKVKVTGLLNFRQLAKPCIGSCTRAFRRAIDEVRTLPLSLPKGGSKIELFRFWLKLNFNSMKSAAKFIWRKTFSSKVVVQSFPYLTVHRLQREM